MIERFFTSESLAANGEISLDGQEFHHLVHVMRASINDQVELVNGRGTLATATIVHLDKKKAVLRVDSVIQEAHPKSQVVIAQAIPRLNRLDFILEKGTELGMTQLWLFPGEKGERHKLTEHQIERMRSVTIAAMKQCGRLYLPEIHLKSALKDWKELGLEAFFGDPRSTIPFSSVLSSKPESDLLFFIGPESGFSENETVILERLKAKGVKLHDNVLRTDTASLVALSVISSCRH